ncbi:MAG: hypothetical protein ACYCPP_08845 [Nitrososphaerales archaeon]
MSTLVQELSRIDNQSGYFFLATKTRPEAAIRTEATSPISSDRIVFGLAVTSVVAA